MNVSMNMSMNMDMDMNNYQHWSTDNAARNALWRQQLLGGMHLFLNLCHLLCGVPHDGWRGLDWRGNAFLSADFVPWSPDRAPQPRS